MADVKELTSDNFESEVLKSNDLVIVDFWSTYCGPCKHYAQIVHNVADENDDVKVCKLNVDDAQDLALKYGINAVPTTVFFKGGEEKERLTGVQAKCRLNGDIKKLK